MNKPFEINLIGLDSLRDLSLLLQEVGRNEEFIAYMSITEDGFSFDFGYLYKKENKTFYLISPLPNSPSLQDCINQFMKQALEGIINTRTRKE